MNLPPAQQDPRRGSDPGPGSPVRQLGPDEIELATPLAHVARIGPASARRLGSLGIANVGQLFAYLPMRHEQLEAEADIRELLPGRLVASRGEITATRAVTRPHTRKPRFEAVLLDGTGRLDLVWFNQVFLREKIHPGTRLRVEGKAQRFGGNLQLVNPRFEILDDARAPAPREARVRPVYPASERVTSREVERAVQAIIGEAGRLIEDHLGEEYRPPRRLPRLAEAYRMIHAPRTLEEALNARRRLAYDELLFLQLAVHMKRAHLRRALRAPALRHSAALDAHIRARFPFPLTPEQDSVIADIAADLSSDTPTNRLIQGDVGSGKTVVALYAMLMAVASGRQAALMAPTEILAEQHFASISAMLAGSKVRIGLLTGGTPRAERNDLLDGLLEPPSSEGGRGIDILVGTHALLTESVRFRSLAVAIIDEQHRFGVSHRARLRENATLGADGGEVTPHVLVMTATPIPRTLAITLFGDLDVSTIGALPPGRRPVKTRVVGRQTRDKVYAFVRERLDAGDQAFIVVPAIDEEETAAGVASVRALIKELQETHLSGKRLAALHGRLRRSTRDQVMEQFRAGRIDALVATTVVEVGVDVPNATLMIVENADSFGLAQLHQLRGRVGRGSKSSVCVLIADPTTEGGEARLRVMESISDGFLLAEKDLEIRGVGELIGTRQSGLPPFKVADLMRDRDLLAMARRDAAEWIGRSPGLGAPHEAVVRRRLFMAYGASLDLADVG